MRGAYRHVTLQKRPDVWLRKLTVENRKVALFQRRAALTATKVRRTFVASALLRATGDRLDQPRPWRDNPNSKGEGLRNGRC